VRILQGLDIPWAASGGSQSRKRLECNGILRCAMRGKRMICEGFHGFSRRGRDFKMESRFLFPGFEEMGDFLGEPFFDFPGDAVAGGGGDG
jgi:hypothetical protein